MTPAHTDATDGASTFPSGTDQNGEAPAASAFFWWCSTCHRRTPFGYDQLDQFWQRGWPVCCGEVVLGYARKSFEG